MGEDQEHLPQAGAPRSSPGMEKEEPSGLGFLPQREGSMC